jgi:hypothetical protein
MGAPSNVQTFLGGLAGGTAQGMEKEKELEQRRQDREAQLRASNQMRLDLLRQQQADPVNVAKIKELERAGALKDAMAEWYKRRSTGGNAGTKKDPAKNQLDAQKSARAVAAQTAGLAKGTAVTSLSPEAAQAYENTYHQFMTQAVPGYVPKPIFKIDEGSGMPWSSGTVQVLQPDAVNESVAPSPAPVAPAGGNKVPAGKKTPPKASEF